jgi:hypothetical protein
MIVYAEPGVFVGLQRRVYSYGPSWITEIGVLCEDETLEDFLKQEESHEHKPNQD